ncbi:hypothetical protein LIER_07044 [Lithospermum erythrorhizon]|uniref:Uncharacterized protein n=1 Tax=Lithospermum erythrorhizon TaxID=34254 RepID=A0AAV3P8K3_LITER
MGQKEEALIPPTLQVMPVADNLGLHNPNREYWKEERILLYFERETRIVMQFSLEENGLTDNLQGPTTENVVSDKYFEDWSMVKNSLQNYCENSGVAWMEEWDEVLNLAGEKRKRAANVTIVEQSIVHPKKRRFELLLVQAGTSEIQKYSTETNPSSELVQESGKQGVEQRESTGEESNDIDQKDISVMEQLQQGRNEMHMQASYPEVEDYGSASIIMLSPFLSSY